MLPSCPWAVFTLNNLIANQRGFFHPPDTKYAVSFQIPLLQLPDTNYLEIASDSTYWRVESHKTGPPLQMPVVRPRILYFFWWNSYKSGVPTMTSPGSTVCWNDSQNSGEHFMTVTSLLEKILVRDGQMGKMHRTKVRWKECGAFLSSLFKYNTFPAHSSMCSPTQKLSELHCLGVLMKILWHRGDWLNHWPLLPQLYPPWKLGSRTKSSNPLIPPLVPLATRPYSEVI